MKHSSLIAAGAATLLLVAYSLGMSATSARSQGVLDDNFLIPILGEKWPPRASDMVVIDGTFPATSNFFHKVYTVPANKWFVLTDVRIEPPKTYNLVQRLKQKEQVKLGWMTGKSSGSSGSGFSKTIQGLGSHRVGIPFSPGSEIGFRQVRNAAASGLYHLRGYLTDR